jgi:PRC-barrel domain
MTISSCVCLIGLLTVLPLDPLALSCSPAARGAAIAQQTVSTGPTNESLSGLVAPDGLTSVLGREVRTASDRDLGRIIDVLADQDGNVRAVVIEFGGFLGIGTRKIAVEWSALRFDREGGHQFGLVDVTRDQLRAAPEYKANAPTILPRASN